MVKRKILCVLFLLTNYLSFSHEKKIDDVISIYLQRISKNESELKQTYSLVKVFNNYIVSKQNTVKNIAVAETNSKNYKKSIEYFLEVKEKELLLQKEIVHSKTLQINWLIIGIIFLISFLSILVYFYWAKAKKNKLITTQKEQLKELNTVKNYLFSVVSHDMRSVIHHIKQNTVKAKKQIDDNHLHKVSEVVNNTITLVNSASHLLNNILSWSLEEGNLVFFDYKEHSLKSLLEQVIFDYKDFASQKNIQLHTEIKEDVLVKADTESLKVVFRNLLDNALKYTSKEIYFKLKKINEAQCVFSIKDSGPGLDSETIAFVNNRESALTNKKIDRSKGLGLGLFLCKTLTQKNKGSLTVNSTPQGTTFNITLNTVS